MHLGIVANPWGNKDSAQIFGVPKSEKKYDIFCHIY